MTQVTTAGFAFVEFVAETTDSLVPLFERLPAAPQGVHPTAVVSPTARVAPTASIGPGAWWMT